MTNEIGSIKVAVNRRLQHFLNKLHDEREIEEVQSILNVMILIADTARNKIHELSSKERVG